MDVWICGCMDLHSVISGALEFPQHTVKGAMIKMMVEKESPIECASKMKKEKDKVKVKYGMNTLFSVSFSFSFSFFVSLLSSRLLALSKWHNGLATGGKVRKGNQET